ncbi:hypothetical protein GA707_03475 [Nostocoides sp. F2B08]|nr:hypothetical protein GA707_03475 [Tetrasphaera sp. F2B08]
MPRLAGVSADEFRSLADDLIPHGQSAVLVVHPALVPASRLAPLLDREGRPGFVVEDMTDLDEFVPADPVVVPDRPLYLIHQPERGDSMRNWSPEEAMAAILAQGRSPLTVSEGISWLLHRPELLQPNHCFMTIGSRKPRARGGLDARTPAIWISGGTGRDGREHRDSPKVGWCWARNRHTWLGFASTAGRGPFG